MINGSLGVADRFAAEYGAWTVGILIGLESLGLPLPGETALVSAAIYTATTGRLSLVGLFCAAATGAVLGDGLGYLIGRMLGWHRLCKLGRHAGIGRERLQFGRVVFLQHGGKIVIAGRFVAILRVLVALLAGALHMPWRKFAIFNALGGMAWVTLVGGGAYLLGTRIRWLLNSFGILGFALGALVVIALMLAAHRGQSRWQADVLRRSRSARVRDSGPGKVTRG
jgi:membrane protein DedA with SNARE-associated domain